MSEVGPVSRRTFLQRMAAVLGSAIAVNVVASEQPVPPKPDPSAKPTHEPPQHPWRNHITTYSYDSNGHVVRITENGIERAVLPTRYEYRPSGSVTMGSDELPS